MSRIAGRIALAACVAFLAAPAAGHGAPSLVDPGLDVRTAASGLDAPIGMAFLGPNEILVLEKNTGRVMRVTDGTVAGPVLDLPVNSAWERGLLGIAIHPDFAENGFVYLYWTESTTGADSNALSATPLLGNRVDRFVWDATAKTLTFDRDLIHLRAIQDDATQPSHQADHNAGVLRFGPDGKLYVLIGDVGRRGQLQNLVDGPAGDGTADDSYGGPEPDNAHLTSAILRLNDDGTTPSDNPFFATGAAMGGEVGANVERLFAYGIRNSFGMAFDQCSGDLWAQENGDDSFDEINRVEPGFNSGFVQLMGPPDRVAQYKAIETDPTVPQPYKSSGYFGLQQVRWSPTNIADTPAEALSRLFALPGSHYGAPELSWKFPTAPGGIGFLAGNALGAGYGSDLFVGAARLAPEGPLEGGHIFRLDLSPDREGIASSDPRLADLVADNSQRFDINESETLLFGRGFGVATDIQTGPNGNLYVVSLTDNAIYEIFRTAPGEPDSSDGCRAAPPPEPEPPGPGPELLTLELEAKKQKLRKRLKFFAAGSVDSSLVAYGKAVEKRTQQLTGDVRTKIEVKLKPRKAEKLEERLDRRGRAKTRIKATATDEIGAIAGDKVRVKLKE